MSVIISNYIPRLSAPIGTDKNWIKSTNGGYNHAMKIGSDGSVLPNCTGYIHGRWLELMNYKPGDVYPNLSLGNAKSYYGHSDIYTRSQTPRLGSIICWKGDWGHVAIVEKINGSTITISQSGYNSTRFKTLELKYPYKYGSKIFQGFIECPFVENDPIPVVDPFSKGDKVTIIGTGSSQAAKKVRTAYGIGYKRYILKIFKGYEYPYKVGNKIGITTGFYKAEALKKGW